MNKLAYIMNEAYEKRYRLVAPLIGFPGVKITGSTIKLAQQNCREHFNTINALYSTFKPDIIFPLMDLSVEANALGRYTIFPKDDSATVPKDEFSLSELDKLNDIDISFDSRVLGYVETIKLARMNIPDPTFIAAYITGPYTLAALLIGAEEAAIQTILKPEDLHQVCELATRKILDYTKLLIASGAQIICILEPSAVMLGPDHFEDFSVKYVYRITDECHNLEVSTVYHICGNSNHLIQKMVEANVDALSLDSPEFGVNLPKVIKIIPQDLILLGNISPTRTILRETPNDVAKEVNYLLTAMNPYPNFILSTGCDLPQETPLENIRAFMDAGKNFRIT